MWIPAALRDQAAVPAPQPDFASVLLLLAVAGPILARLADPLSAGLRHPSRPGPPAECPRASAMPAEVQEAAATPSKGTEDAPSR